MSPEEELPPIVQAVNDYSRAFDNLVSTAHTKDVAENGLQFLGEGVIEQMIEALVTTVLLCRKQAIKLMMLQTLLEENTQIDGQVEVELNNFKSTGEATSF